MKETKDLETN